jgi:hypothetical protein
MWLEPMDKLFPKLGDLSVFSMTTDSEMSLALPETLQAPDLRRLTLHGIGLPKRLSLLSSTIALLTLSLTHIRMSCYFPPGHLVTHLPGLPHLEELSIGFAIPIPVPSSEGELLLPPIPPVTLPTLRRLTFRGVGAYLENLVAQIHTPHLERLNLTLFFEVAFRLVNLAEFIRRAEGFGCLVAGAIFNKDGASIDADNYGQPGNEKLSLRVNCKRLDWQIDSAIQVCSALRGVLSTVEDLTVNLDVDGMPSDWGNVLDELLWHELLLPFIGVRKLHIGLSLTLELSQALGLVAGGLVMELLPELRELEVQLEVDQAKNAFSLFLETRESVDRPVRLLTSLIPRVEPEVLHAVPQGWHTIPQVHYKDRNIGRSTMRQLNKIRPSGPPTEEEIWKVARRTINIIESSITGNVCLFGSAASALWADIGRVPDVRSATQLYLFFFDKNDLHSKHRTSILSSQNKEFGTQNG